MYIVVRVMDILKKHSYKNNHLKDCRVIFLADIIVTYRDVFFDSIIITVNITAHCHISNKYFHF